MMSSYADIAVNAYNPSNLGTYTYTIPDGYKHEALEGTIVQVPFGNKQVKGVIIKCHSTPPKSGIKLKPISTILSNYPGLSQWQIDLIRWLARYYHCSFHLAVRTVAPFLYDKPDQYLTSIKYAIRTKQSHDGQRLGPKQQLLLDLLSNSDSMSLQTLRQDHGISSATIKSLTHKGLLEISQETSLPDLPILQDPAAKTSHPPDLLPAAIENLDLRPDPKPQLIHVDNQQQQISVITRVAQSAQTGKQLLVIVPEINQVELLWKSISSIPANSCVWHSELSSKQRFAVWSQVQTNQLQIVIGTRSSIFLPFADLGTIFITDEHDPDHKQIKNPRYHTRTVAYKLSQLRNSSLLLSSFTPSVESYYHAQTNTYTLTSLISNQLPLQSDSQLIDLTAHRLPRRSLLSHPLRQAITETLSQARPVMLFINRRGAARSVYCRDCGHTFKCPICESTLIYHQSKTIFRCHTCGYMEQPAEQCPSCQGTNIQYRGSGTQTVEKELNELYPDTRISRIDSDTCSTLEDIHQLRQNLINQNIDIMVGTRLLTTLGMDSNPGLVGVLHADLSLMIPDFRSGERTYQQLVALLNLAEQAKPASRTMIQTYQPDNQYILAALNKDYRTFLKQELAQRQEGLYPPFSRLILLSIEHPQEQVAIDQASALKAKMEQKGHSALKISGPFPAYNPRQRGKYVHHLLLSGDKPHTLLDLVPNDVTVVVDPIELL